MKISYTYSFVVSSLIVLGKVRQAYIIRSFRMESKCLLASLCPSVRPSLCPFVCQRGPYWTGIREVLSVRIFMKFGGVTPNSVKLGQKFGNFTWRPKHSLLLPAVKALLRNTPYFCIVDSDVYLNNTRRSYCCFSICNSGYANAQQCYVLRALPILFFYEHVFFFKCFVISLQKQHMWSIQTSVSVVPTNYGQWTRNMGL
jgi:hypothetical protein